MDAFTVQCSVFAITKRLYSCNMWWVLSWKNTQNQSAKAQQLILSADPTLVPLKWWESYQAAAWIPHIKPQQTIELVYCRPNDNSEAFQCSWFSTCPAKTLQLRKLNRWRYGCEQINVHMESIAITLLMVHYVPMGKTHWYVCFLCEIGSSCALSPLILA